MLSGTTINLRRQVERVEQGMGRGIRSNDDYCVVLLLGSKLTGRLRSLDAQTMLMSATKAQVRLSQLIAKQLKNPTLDEIKAVIFQCIDRDPNWVRLNKTILVNLQADDELRLDPAKLAIRSAFDSARSHRYEDAVAVLDEAISATTDEQVKAWLLSRKAIFQHQIDAAGAQVTLAVAHKLEPSVLKPMYGTVYKVLSASTGQQAGTLIANHEQRFTDATDKKLFIDDLCSNLQFSAGTSDKFEAAVNELAWFLGIRGQRPEREYKEGPDNLWALPNGTFLVIECKNGGEAQQCHIKKRRWPTRAVCCLV